MPPPPPNQNLPQAPGTGKTGFIGPLADAYQRLDPATDGWPTEAFSGAAGTILKHLHDLPPESVSPDVSTTPLTLPKSTLKLTHDGPAFTVHRAGSSPPDHNLEPRRRTSKAPHSPARNQNRPRHPRGR